jgi:hypothetical protein
MVPFLHSPFCIFAYAASLAAILPVEGIYAAYQAGYQRTWGFWAASIKLEPIS